MLGKVIVVEKIKLTEDQIEALTAQNVRSLPSPIIPIHPDKVAEIPSRPPAVVSPPQSRRFS